MAKERTITRTIKSTRLKILCMNTETEEKFETELVIPTPRRAGDLLKIVEAKLNTDTTKVVKVKSSEVFETKYAMTETDFMTNDKAYVI